MENSTPTPVLVPASKNNLLIPAAIVIAGVLIAGALFITRNDSSGQNAQRPKNEYLEKNLVAVTSEDHIQGSPSAPIIIVEHSDTDCPYCQTFHPTLQRIIDQYTSTGKVAWVYRHFAFHPKAPKEAEATECVAAIGGNDAFWSYLGLLFSKKNFREQPYKGIDPAELPTLAASIGVNKAAVSKCLKDGTYSQKVTDQSQDTTKAGGTGTPYSVIISKVNINKSVRKIVEDANKKFLGQNLNYPDILYVSQDKRKIVLNGAMPQELVNQIIQALVEIN